MVSSAEYKYIVLVWRQMFSLYTVVKSQSETFANVRILYVPPDENFEDILLVNLGDAKDMPSVSVLFSHFGQNRLQELPYHPL